MKNKSFTLIELIIAVIVIAIISSIVVVKIMDMKNKSIGAAVSNNTKIIQTAVDRYTLDNDGEHPVKNDLVVNLQNPRLIDVELLKDKGYLKKELDTSKIKKQYYWLDVFNVVWGSTESTVNDISSVTGKDGSKKLEFITPEGAVAYRIYEVTGYNKTGSITNKKDRHYKLVSEVELKKKRQKISFKIPDSSKIYLISAVDKYEQETSPVGVFYKGPAGFKPIFSGEGIYEFMIESFDEMFWVDFKTVEDKPGDATISYRFKVRDEKGVYGNWTDNFKGLPSSKGITVEVILKADGDGNKPSLYDLQVMYRYAYEEMLQQPPVVLTGPESSSNICPAGYTTSTIQNEQWSENQQKMVTYLVNLDDGVSIDKIRTPYFTGYSIVSVKYEYAKEEGTYAVASGTFEIPSGSCVNIIYVLEKNEDGIPNKQVGSAQPGGSNPGIPSETKEALVPNNSNTIAPEIITCKDNCVPVCKDCVPVCMENCVDYCDTHKCTEEEKCKLDECIEPPVCKEGETGCTPPVCTDKCLEGPPTAPNPQDSEVNDPNWVTVETMRFFANGPLGVPTRWIGMIPDHEVEDGKTRVVYRYATSNGHYWSNELDQINKVGQSRSLMVIAYLQVHKDVKDNPTLKQPKVNSIQVIHEKGSMILTDIQPTLTIMPIKDNNEGRDIFSDTSNITWDYVAYDPRGRKITDIKWAGDKRETYPVGTYTVKASVKNEVEVWSEEISYTFEVLSEKPVAKITNNPNIIFLNKQVDWSAAQSFDPDGDKIVKTEWRGDKQNVYDKKDTYIVELRVRDSEGNWSDWIEKKFDVTDEGLKVYRLEAEDTDTTKVSGYKNILIDSQYNDGKANSLHLGAKMEFRFVGTGFDLKHFNNTIVEISIDGVVQATLNKTGEEIYSIRNLENKSHTLSVKGISNQGFTAVDYIDVYSPDDTPDVLNLHSNPINIKGVESNYDSNEILVNKGQNIRTHYTLHKDSYVSIGVYDANNIRLKTLQESKLLEGGTIRNHSVDWNGIDSQGEVVSTGDYYLKITAIGMGKRGQKEKTYPLFVDNEKPIYRLEAEDTDTTKVNGSKNIITDSKYNGGKANRLILGSVANYYFVGTGFDLKQLNNTNIQVSIDGKIQTNLTKTGEEIYSVRNLENKYHTITLKGISNQGSTDVDYIDIYSSDDTPNIVDIVSRPVAKNGIESNYASDKVLPSLESSVRTYYTLQKNAYVTISVYDVDGKEIRSLQLDKLLEGGTVKTHSITWDGKDNNGNIVLAGTYTLKVKASGINKVGKTEKTHTLYVNNQNPTYRIEGEATEVIKSRVNVISNTKFSAGKASSFGLAGTVTFYITGTGFDLKQFSNTNVEIYIDGVVQTTLMKTGEHTYSIRDMANKAHTVVVKCILNTGATEVDYMDVYQ